MIFDLFPVYNEIDLVKVRMAELADVADVRHVAMEARQTHQGSPKARYVADARAKDPALQTPRLALCQISDFPEGFGAWEREREQRDRLLGSLTGVADDDLVLSCDVDEIVRASDLERIWTATERGPVKLGLRFHCYSKAWFDPIDWRHAAAFRWRDRPESLSALRLDFRLPVVANCGWHLSWWGGADQARRKLSAFAHTEHNTAEKRAHADDMILHGVSIHGYVLERTPAEWDWPKGLP